MEETVRLIKTLGLLALVITTQNVRAELGTAGGATIFDPAGLVWYVNVSNRLPTKISVQGYLIESWKSGLFWAPWETFKNTPKWTEIPPATTIRVASLNERGPGQAYWQFYTYHLNVIVGDERHGFTVNLGWAQRKAARDLIVAVSKHKWHEIRYPNYTEEAVGAKDGVFVYTITKDAASAKDFDATAFGIKKMESQFASDKNSRYDRDTVLANKVCNVTINKKRRIERTLKGDPGQGYLTTVELDDMKKYFPDTYQQLTSPVTIYDTEYTMTCYGQLLHPTKTIQAELIDGPIYTKEVPLEAVLANSATDPSANVFVG